MHRQQESHFLLLITLVLCYSCLVATFPLDIFVAVVIGTAKIQTSCSLSANLPCPTRGRICSSMTTMSAGCCIAVMCCK